MGKKDAMGIISDWKNEKVYVNTVGFNLGTGMLVINRKVFNEMTGLVDGSITLEVPIEVVKSKFKNCSDFVSSVKKFSVDNALQAILGIS